METQLKKRFFLMFFLIFGFMFEGKAAIVLNNTSLVLEGYSLEWHDVAGSCWLPRTEEQCEAECSVNSEPYLYHRAVPSGLLNYYKCQVKGKPVFCRSPYKLRMEFISVQRYLFDCEAYCAVGETWDALAERCIPPRDEQSCKTQGQNPIDFIRGRKYRTEAILSSGIRYPFSLTYFFNNQRNQEKTLTGSHVAVVPNDRYLASTSSPLEFSSYQNIYTNLGVPAASTLYKPTQYYGSLDQFWRHNFDEVLQILGNQYIFHSAKGQEITFSGYGITTTYPAINLQPLLAGEETFAGYKITDSKTQEAKKFDSNGRLMKIERSPIDILTLTYDNQNRLERITNSEGAFITLVYQSIATNSIYDISVSEHSYPTIASNNRGESAQIAWGSSYAGQTAKFHLVTRITEATTGPAQSARTFEYNDPRWPSSITDQYFVADLNSNDKQKTLHFDYDELGRATYSGLAGGKQSDGVTYVNDSTRIVTNALGKNATYQFADLNGVRRLQNVTGEPTQNCVSSATQYEYDAAGNVQRETKNGQITTYQHDGLGRETSRTEASGTPEARTFTTEWHPTLGLKTKVTEPGKETIYSYDANGLLLNQTTRSLP